MPITTERMEDYFMNGPDLKASPTPGGFSEFGLSVPSGLENTSNQSKQQPSNMMRETKTTESGAEKKRPLVRDAMLMGNSSSMPSSRDGKRSLSAGMTTNGLAKLPSHLQAGSSTEQWNAQCPSFMSSHSWRGISTELRKDLKVGEWAYSCSTQEMWWSVAVHQIFDDTPAPFTPPSFERYRGLLHPDDRDQVLFLFQRAIERGIPYDVTHRLYLPNKTIKWCRCMCRIQFHSVTKKVEKLIGTLQDISSWAQSIKTNILVESEENNEIIIDEATLDEEPACIIS